MAQIKNIQKRKITLLTGGARSGKSNQALFIAESAKKPAFVATAQAMDEEMAERIKKHQAERSDAFELCEEPLAIAKAITKLAETCDLVLLDCLTLWLANLMNTEEAESLKELKAFEELLKMPPCAIVIVTNEIGMGLVPATAMGREFRDQMGRLNQEVARLADEVFFMVSGLPLVVKTNR
ncbi:MAG: bifunctional adenosylcobinamide kinase/adenosylcobinamide-phosphate guanylyltransferase [SAR324 cluster bacterium]|nr:bifunctional adenosylcobinamide kinase/adenosylcobinamide-phosphate guanylyltransferase [SAR324 cluster bacterium]